MSKRWPEPEAEYRRRFYEREHNDFALGAVQFVNVEPELWVANMIAQDGVGWRDGVPPIRYDALESCLWKVADRALELGASVHAPRIGSGLAGGNWREIEPIIVRTLCAMGVDVTVYDLK